MITTNLTIILACLSMIESGDNDLAVGKHGERGRYQISEEVWKEYDWWHMDFKTHARERYWSDIIAETILKVRTQGFQRLFSKDPTPFETYVLWNAPAQIGHPSPVVSEKAQRFENLVKDKMKGVK